MLRQLSSSSSSTDKPDSIPLKLSVKANSHQWMKLFIAALIPLMIAVLTITTTLMQEKNATKQRKQSEHQADILRQDTILATYFDDISKLLLLDNRTKLLPNIRAKTLTTLRRLDPRRKRYLLLFLYENGLIFRQESQSVATLLNLNTADLNSISSVGTIENECTFVRLYLPDVYLSNTSFVGCYIDRSNFSRSTMYRTSMINSLILRTSFKFTILDKSQFHHTKFNNIDFLGASLVESNFTGSILSKDGVNFTNANLSRAVLSNEQLNNATFNNSILPNGTWGPIKTDNLIINGNAEGNCTINGSNIINGWTIATSYAAIKMLPYSDQNNTKDFGKCYFRVTSFFQAKPVASMNQVLNLEQFSLLFSTSNARYHASVNFQCFGNQYGGFELRFVDFNGLRYPGVYKRSRYGTQMQTVQLSDIVRWDVRTVEVFISFVTETQNKSINATLDQHYCICDNVQFSITKVQ